MAKVENEISGEIVDTCYQIHSRLGPGLLESVYEEILFYELEERNFKVKRQKGIPVKWKEIKMNLGFMADLIVEALAPVHYKQLLTYLKLTNLKLGLLINFNDKLIKNGINRVVNNL